MLNGVNPKDGLGILRRLQEIYAPASMKDRNQALAYLNELQMHPKDTITNFIQKFQRALKTLADVSRHTTPPDESEMMHLFVQKCLRTVSEGSDLRQTLLFYERILCHQVPGQPLPFTMSQMESDLCQHDNTLGKSKTSKSSFHSHNNRHTHSSRDSGKRSSANSAKKYQKPVKCLKCGGNHKLIACRKATDQEKKDLWEAYRKTWTSTRTSKSTNSTNQANHTKQQVPTTPTVKSTDQTTTEHQAHAVIPSQKFSEANSTLGHYGTNQRQPFKTI